MVDLEILASILKGRELIKFQINEEPKFKGQPNI